MILPTLEQMESLLHTWWLYAYAQSANKVCRPWLQLFDWLLWYAKTTSEHWRHMVWSLSQDWQEYQWGEGGYEVGWGLRTFLLLQLSLVSFETIINLMPKYHYSIQYGKPSILRFYLKSQDSESERHLNDPWIKWPLFVPWVAIETAYVFIRCMCHASKTTRSRYSSRREIL